MMKKQFLIHLLLITAITAGCGNATTGNTKAGASSPVEVTQQTKEADAETLQLTSLNLTEKEWQEIKSSHNKLEKAEDEIRDGDDYGGSLDINLAGIATPEDVSLGGMIAYHKLKQQNYRFLTKEAYLKRIEHVFGFNPDRDGHIDRIKFHKDYSVVIYPEMAMNIQEDNLPDKEFYPYRDHHFYFKDFCFSTVNMPSVQCIELDKSPNKDCVNIYNSYFDFHWNNYTLNDNPDSFLWLIDNGFKHILKDLLFTFGYDKDNKLNKYILDEISQSSTDGYTIESFSDIFAGRDLNGKLQIHKNLLKYMQENPTNDYAQMLFLYGDYCLGDAAEPYFTKEERFKVAAYIAYYMRLIYIENANREGDGYIIINDALFQNIGDLVNEEGNPSDEGEDSEFLQMIVKNDYYNLPKFKEMVDKMIDDYRLKSQVDASDSTE